MKYVQLTGPPYPIKYHTTFLKRFQGNIEQDQPKAQSQETKMSNNKDQHLDNKSTIAPPNVRNTTTPPTEPDVKRPRTDELEDPQTTQTQIWTPRPTQVLNFETEADDKQQDNKELTEIEQERRRKLAATTNPYSQSKQQRTPMVTPQKTCTHTKLKSISDTPRTNLKDPPAPTPRNINNELEQDPTQELEEIVTNTERIMDQATAAFHEEDNNASQTCLAIEGLSTIALTAETNNQMLLMIQFMDKLGDKYRHILKEHKENETCQKEKFKELLSNLTKLYEHQARINMEHIITTQSSNAEQKMQQQLHKLV
jgi:hypothetical protein